MRKNADGEFSSPKRKLLKQAEPSLVWQTPNGQDRAADVLVAHAAARGPARALLRLRRPAQRAQARTARLLRALPPAQRDHQPRQLVVKNQSAN
jgi:hypothetical protein